ncbi:MAG: radical SAM/SPASM domain-containing protein [Candidatus Binatia bacterium]
MAPLLPAAVRGLPRRLRRLVPTLREFRRNAVETVRPSILVLAAASRCNASCSFCFDFKRLEGVMSLAQFEHLLDKLAPDLELVDFSFYGEALLNPELPALIASARARGLGTILYSNGMLLDAERSAALAASGIDAVVINLNAWMPDFKVDSPDTLPARHVGQVDAFVAACPPQTLVVLQVIAPRARVPFRRRALAARFAAAPNLTVRVKREELFSYDRPIAPRAPVRCYRPFEEIAVSPDGEVLVCCKDMLRKHGFGNLLTDDLDTIWVERMNTLRRHNDAALCARCEAPSDVSRFAADVVLSPLGARTLYLRTAAALFARR